MIKLSSRRIVPVVFSGVLFVSYTMQSSVHGQALEELIEVGEDIPVLIESEGLATIEPHLAVNPRNHLHLVAGVFLVERMGDPRFPDPERPDILTCTALTSFDGGETWDRHDFKEPFCLDPWAAILNDGSAVFLGLSAGELFQYRSSDGGLNWEEEPVNFGRGFDHGTLVVDTTPGPFTDNLYVAANRTIVTNDGQRRAAVFTARSSDGGRTYAETAELVPSNLTSFAMNPVILSEGTLTVPFVNFSRLTANGGTVLLDEPPSWVVVSNDGGNSFSPPRFITTLCARGFPELAVAPPMGEYANRLYFVCNDRSREHIYMHNSSDQGESWSGPVVVNGQSGQDPLVFNAVIAVNANGVVGVSWYDARNDPRGYRGTTRCQNVFFAASLDGGVKFLPEVKVSTEENCPDTAENGETGRRWFAGGDYHGLVALPDGKFQILWADSRSGIYQLRTATLRVQN